MSQWSPHACAQSTTESSSLLRPSVQGKFLFLGQEKLYVRGVTYGPFPPAPDGSHYHNPDIVERDLAQMVSSGVNAIRTYTVPPPWLLDLAQQYGVWVMVGLAWEQHIAFLSSRDTARGIERRVRDGVNACAGHPAILAFAVGNEIPAPIVRWHGARAIERFLRQLYETVKEAAPTTPVTYVNYPTTEYLQLPFLDLACFNVYLESQDQLESYLARLQNVVGDRPLLLTELGLDSLRHGEAAQADALNWQIETAMRGGCAGAFVFSWTDEWYRGDEEIRDWQFGLTDRQRQPKPALEAVRQAFVSAPFGKQNNWPRVSVVVCTYNGAQTIGECCEALCKLDYPDYEVIVVDDGSTDGAGAIAAGYGFRVIRTERQGLSAARNEGLAAATGEVVAYIDDDAYPDRHWLRYLVPELIKSGSATAGVGGPNLVPPDEGLIGQCVGNAPGGPVHVLLSDREAEHIPGVNMAFRKECLEAIGGFDPRFRVAGDDVDICWRIQQQGWRLTFSPAAVVWHHPRCSIGDYWRQQTGYGRAEALLEKKWPEKYNLAGHFTWRGRVYDVNGNGNHGLLELLGFWRRGRIYQGTWGSAPFQSLYQPASQGWWSLVLMPEWYLLVTALAAFSMPAMLPTLGMLEMPGSLASSLLAVLPLFLLTFGVSMGHALSYAANVHFSTRLTGRGARFLRVGLTAFLTLIQPLARLNGRLRAGLTIWRRHEGADGSERNDAPLARSILQALRLRRNCLQSLWSERWQGPETWLRTLESTLRRHGAVVRRGEAFDRWDLEIRTGTFAALRLLMAIEEHGGGRQLLHFRVWPSIAGPLLWLWLLVGILATGMALAGVWRVAVVLACLLSLLVLRVLSETGGTIYSVLQALEQVAVASRREEPSDEEADHMADGDAEHAPELEILVRRNGHARRTRVAVVALRPQPDRSHSLNGTDRAGKTEGRERR